MLIKKIKLQNFKSFQNAEIELGRMNVLVGANASGKSNFIQAIKFLRDIQEFGLENAISIQGGFDYLKNNQAKASEAIVINIEIESFVVSKELEEGLVLLDILNTEYEIKIREKNTSEFRIEESLQLDIYVAEGKLISPNYYTPINPEFITNYTITNELGNITLSNSIHQSIYKLSSGEEIAFSDDKNAEYGLNDSAWEIKKGKFTKMDTIINKMENNSWFGFDIDKEHLSIYDFDSKKIKTGIKTGKIDLEENGENLPIVISHLLKKRENKRRLLNTLADSLGFVEDIQSKKMIDDSTFFEFKEQYNKKKSIPSFLLSDGTVISTAIIIALLFDERRINIFEEPDKGIHPSLMSKLMHLFYEISEEKQIIITTHNTEVVRHTRIEDLHLVSRNGQGTVFSKPAEKEMVRQFLANDMGISDLFVTNLLEI